MKKFNTIHAEYNIRRITKTFNIRSTLFVGEETRKQVKELKINVGQLLAIIDNKEKRV